MTTVAKVSISFYARDKKLTDLDACDSADLVDLTDSMSSFITTTMRQYGPDGKLLTREQRKEVNKLFTPDDVIDVDIEDEPLVAYAKGKFTNEFLAKYVNKKIPFGASSRRADEEDEDGNADCLSSITHIMFTYSDYDPEGMKVVMQKWRETTGTAAGPNSPMKNIKSFLTGKARKHKTRKHKKTTRPRRTMRKSRF